MASLRAAFRRVLDEYHSEMAAPFASNPLAAFLRRDCPNAVHEVVDRVGDYIVAGSAGQGTWTKSPWVAIFDPLITDSAQRGYYPVYLFREDFTGFYLSLNQGVTEVRGKYLAKAKDALRAKAVDFRARVGTVPAAFSVVEIDLKPASPNSYAADYEAGNICAKFYSTDAIPDDQGLANDLLQMLAIYRQVSDIDPDLDSAAVEDDEQDLIDEDHSKMRSHKRIERNPNVSKKVKAAQGYVCKVCSFDFKKAYPGIENNLYIEAHHLVPISELKGMKVRRDPNKDFAVLCANCHRMIHRMEDTSNVKALIAAMSA